MFRYYTLADLCFVYLADVRSTSTSENSEFNDSRWHERGWTISKNVSYACVRTRTQNATNGAGDLPIRCGSRLPSARAPKDARDLRNSPVSVRDFVKRPGRAGRGESRGSPPPPGHDGRWGWGAVAH